MRGRLVAVVVLLLAATACGGLPTPSGVRSVRAVAQDEQRDESTVREIPAGPFSGETDRQTASGFLAAGGDPDVAAHFLANGVSWSPYAQKTIVYSGQLPPLRQLHQLPGTATQERFSLTVNGVLEIAQDGTTSAPAPTAVQVGLVLDATGQWRVDKTPDYILVRDTDLAQGHRRVGLTWLAPDRHTLVTEPVILAVPEDALGPAVVTALLKGPPASLSAAGVTSWIPADTHVLRVATDSSTLLVDLELDPGAAPIAAGDVPLVRAQLAATLLPAFKDLAVSSITLTVGGQPLVGAGAGSTGGPITTADSAPLDSTADPTVLAPRALDARNTLAAVARAGQRPLASRSPFVALAVDADAQRYAQLMQTTDGKTVPQLVISGEAPIDIADAGAWTSVAFGPDSSVWLVGSGVLKVRSGISSQAGALAGRAAPTGIAVTAHLRQLVIDSDGVHAVGVTADGGLVAGVVALEPDGQPVVDLQPVSPTVTDAVAVGLDATPGSVIVLRSGTVGDTPAVKGTPPSVARVEIDAPMLDGDLTGAPQPLPLPCGTVLPISITGRAGVDPLVGCANGTVMRLDDGVWAGAGVGLFPSWPLG